MGNDIHGTLFIIAAPSGAGKTSLVKELLKKIDNLSVSTSYTTRQPRKNEVDGKDYHFIEEKKFKDLINKDFFLEHAKVHDNWYGTSLDFVQSKLSSGVNLILEIDVQGFRQINDLSFSYDSIFILPPSMHSLEERIKIAGEMDPVRAGGEESPYACPICKRQLEYRLGKSGLFLSCTGYREKIIQEEEPKKTKTGKTRKKKPKEVPACTFAIPVDELDRKPRQPEQIDLLSPAGVAMVKRTGRFGDFLVEDKPRPVKPRGKKAKDAPTEPPSFILNLDKNGCIKFPTPPPVVTDIVCSKCGDFMNLRDGKRGPWLGCRAFPKCRGREAFGKLSDERKEELKRELADHLAKQTKLHLTRRDGTTEVNEGTPLTELQIEGGVAELPLYQESHD